METLLEKRKITDFNKSIQDVINFMSISRNVHLVGSSSLKSLKYFHDFDLNELFKENGNKDYPKLILNLFRQKYKEAKLNKNTYIVDFKCGIDSNTGLSLNWTMKDINNGYILNSEKEKVYFIDAIFHKAIMNLDVIEILEDGLLGDFSDVYSIQINDKSNFFPFDNSKDFILNGILKSYDEYQYIEKNYYKALKRIFSINRLQKPLPKKNIKLLIDFFNGDVGKMNKVMTNILTIQSFLTNDFKPPNLSIVYLNIKNCIELSSGEIKHMLELCLKKRSIKTIIYCLEKIKNILFDKINKLSLQFENQHKSLLPY